MSGIPNARFEEYSTSGAFTLALTRNQVSALSMMEGGGPWSAMPGVNSLERKGLAEAVPAPVDWSSTQYEFRPTMAGLLTIRLLREAGLVNGGDDPVRAELDALRKEIVARRTEAHWHRKLARSALSRKDSADLELDNLRQRAAGQRMTIRLINEDPLPEFSDSDLATAILTSQEGPPK